LPEPSRPWPITCPQERPEIFPLPPPNAFDPPDDDPFPVYRVPKAPPGSAPVKTTYGLKLLKLLFIEGSILSD